MIWKENVRYNTRQCKKRKLWELKILNGPTLVMMHDMRFKIYNKNRNTELQMVWCK